MKCVWICMKLIITSRFSIIARRFSGTELFSFKKPGEALKYLNKVNSISRMR